MNSKEKKTEGKKFSRAVTEKKENLWEKGLILNGSTLEPLVQKELLKDWLLSDLSFKEVCSMHGLSEEEAENLESKLPKNLISLKKTTGEVDSLVLVGRKTDEEVNRQAILSVIFGGLRLSRKIQIMADLKFAAGTLKPAELGSLVSAWDRILHRIGTFLTEPDLGEAEGFRALMQMTREELHDLRNRIKEYRRYKVEIPEAEVILENQKNE